MKLLTKNRMKFAVGMFWQIPDKGKKTINLSKLVKDTGHNMFCQVGKYNASDKNFNLTYGFCTKDGLQGEKKVSSLGKFIVEASNLTAEYANSIICYKFKDAGELDDTGKPLTEDMFGYIVLLNGTICPDEGEYVAPFDSVRQSVIDQAHVHPIDTLYLPTDVAARFMNIYERLDNAIYDDELLMFVLNSASTVELKELINFIEDNFSEGKFANIKNELIPQLQSRLIEPLSLNTAAIKLISLRQLIQHEIFRNKVKDNIAIDNNIRYLISNIVLIPLSSDQIYWKNNKFKQNYNKSLIQTISSQTSKKYKFGALVIILAIFGYFTYDIVTGKELPLVKPQKPKPVIPKAVPLLPQQLINLCLAYSDRFFKDLNHWTFTGMKCNSLGASYMFTSDNDTTLSAFTELIGESVGVSLQVKNGVFNQKFKIIKNIPQMTNLTKPQIINNLQQAAIDYQYKLTMPTANPKGLSKTKYAIQSKLSPVYLLNHGVLDGTSINEISMTFDKNTGIYHWTIQGEF